MPEMKENLFHFAKEDIEKVENSNSAIARIMERIVISMSVIITSRLIATRLYSIVNQHATATGSKLQWPCIVLICSTQQLLSCKALNAVDWYVFGF